MRRWRKTAKSCWMKSSYEWPRYCGTRRNLKFGMLHKETLLTINILGSEYESDAADNHKLLDLFTML